MKRADRVPTVLVLLATTAVFPAPAQRAEAAAPAFSKTVVTSRIHLVDGVDRQVDSRSVTLSVSATTDLRGRQLVTVKWSGAHPTGGVVLDPNSYNGRLSEYPMVLLECRGVDSGSVSVARRLDPSTCWTQTPNQRYQATFDTAFPAWRLDRHAPADERKAVVGTPANVCQVGASAQRMVPFVGADDTVYSAGDGCGTLPPEATTVPDPAAPPSNTTYAATGPDGSGRAKFEVWTAQQNASLGCSSTVPCSLVAIPIMGVSCDAAAASLPAPDRPTDDPETTDIDEFADAQALCEKTGQYAPGQRQPGQVETSKTDLAVSGALWWSASNWRNRITVPLNFAPFGNVCDILDSRTPVDLYGSELLAQATDQWAPAFCRNPDLFKFRHVRVGEPLAKTGLAGQQFPAALISRPPDAGYPKPTVNAPVAVTGFAVSYAVDDGDQNEVTDLRLTPRLLAKLLSESYLAFPGLKADLARPDDPENPKLNVPAAYKTIAGNPLTIEDDPEFQALNPRVGHNSSVQGGATLLALSANSDVVYALSQYLDADPEARAFLDGKPDPWGMVVNPGYRGIALPVESWPLLDTYTPSPAVAGSEAFKYCLWNTDHQVVSTPLLPLVAAPLTSLSAIAQKAQYSILNSATNCVTLNGPDGTPAGGSFKAVGRQAPGNRFMLALTALADGPRFGLRSAALQTSSVVPDPSATFTDDHGRRFVTPTDDSLRAAMALATPNDTTHTWPVPYQTLRTARGAGAYPGTMVVYAAVPTTGLDHITARRLGQFLEFTATSGQEPGLGQGELPPGYLPMTGANGLGAMVLYTRRAADVVAAQRGAVPSIVETPGPAPAPAPTASPSPAALTTPNPGSPPSAAPASDLSAYRPGVQLPVGYTGALVSDLAGSALPIVAAFGALSLLLAAAVRSRAGARAMARLQVRLTRRIEAEDTR